LTPNPVQPGLCGRCREIVPVEAELTDPLCPKCGGKEPQVLRIYEPEDFIESLGDAARYTCPSCGDPSLRFDIVGVWD
jgi:predicted RNA-binding Zn-ribbon protein involved in translation (DUF1610 family)